MNQYSVHDVEKLVHLPRSRIRSLVEAGFVTPERGPRNTWLFSFQDLIVLRTAQTLTEAKVPPKRITSSVKELRRRLPDSTPLSEVNIGAESKRVVVKEGNRRWRADSGQYLLGFDDDTADPAGGCLPNPTASSRRRGDFGQQGAEQTTSAESRTRAESPTNPGPMTNTLLPTNAEDWFDRGLSLETEDTAAAIEAYEKAIAVDPDLLKARINLGCLLHETGRLERAANVYRDAVRANGHDPVLLYDMGVLLDDMGRKNDAMEAYLAALSEDPLFADCHFNLALLCERLGKPKDAIQHLAAYRRLTTKTKPK